MKNFKESLVVQGAIEPMMPAYVILTKTQSYFSEINSNTYENLFDNMVQFIREPDLIIYLKASTDTLLSRIKNRDREFEKNINPEYIHSLNLYYDRWINKLDKKNTLIINTNKFNIFKDLDRLQEIFKEVEDKLKLM